MACQNRWLSLIRYRRRTWLIATCLASLAGFVDALAFMATGGLFVSFMSGNTTRLSVEASDRLLVAISTGTIIASFVNGVVVGSIVGRYADRRRRPATLLLVGALLALAAVLAGADMLIAAICITAAAMGSENAVYERDGEVSIGLTYMTGTLVKMGQRLATAVTGGPRWTWLPYALLWLGLATGALVGATIFPRLGLQGLWFAVATAAGLAVVTALVDRD